jgi:hypothetical protein
MVAWHDALRITLLTFLAASFARCTIAADLASSAAQTCGLFCMGSLARRLHYVVDWDHSDVRVNHESSGREVDEDR